MRLGATRQAIHDALTWSVQQKGESGLVEYMKYMTRVEKTFKANNGQMTADFLEAGWILAAVNNQPNHVGAWLRYCYGAVDNEFDLLSVAMWLFMENYLGHAKGQGIERHKELCRCSVDDYRLRMRRSKPMPVEAYAQAMGVDSGNFARDWGKKRDTLVDQLQSVDIQGIAKVSIVVRQLKGHGEFENLTGALKSA